MIKVIGKRLLIPPSDRYIALEGDNLSKKVYFCFDEKTLSAAFGDYVNDTSEVGVSLKIMKPGSDSTITAVLTRVPECDVLCGKVWAWTVKRTVTDISGEMQIQLYICYTDDENGTNVIWNSDIGSVFIGDSLDFNEKYDDKEAQIGEFESIVEEASQLITKKVKEELIKTGADIDEFNSHLNDVSNPHGVTAKQIGLGNVDNTSDKDKPVSDAAKAALDKKANFDDMQTAMKTLGITISSHIGSNDNPHKVTAQQIGLGKVDNTADKDKPVSDAVKSELDGKANVSHTHALAGITKEDVDLTACTTVDGEHGNYTINPKSLYGGSALFVLDLDSSKTYEFGGVLESPGYIEVNGEKITEFSPNGGYNSLDFNYSGKISSMRIYLSAGDCTFDYFNAIVPNDGFISGTDKAKLDSLPDESGNEFYVDNEFAVGEGNKLGTRGYIIISYTGKHGENGTYTLEGDETEFNRLKAVFDAETGLKVTVMNDMNWDSGSTVTGVSFTNGNIVMSLENIYTNSDKTPFDASVSYGDQGTVWGSAPELGWTIKKRDGSDADAADWSTDACLFIGGHPELGTFAWYGSQTSFGTRNINQGYASFSNGVRNQARGKYSSAHGSGNIVGYDDHAFGRSNDLSFAQDSIAGGFGNKITNFAWMVAAFGYRLICKKSWQFLAGKFNRNKNTNIMEIGNGNSEDDRKNAFEVDEGSRVALGEEYLPFQKMYVDSYQFSDEQAANLITDLTTQVYTRSISGSGYGPYVAVKAENIGMVNGGWYIMVVGFTNTGVWNAQFKGYAGGGTKPERNVLFATEKLCIPSGKHYFICPIYCNTAADKIFGFYCEKSERTVTIDSVSLYRAVNLPIPNSLKEHETADIISLDSTSNSLKADINEIQTIYGNLVDDISATTHHTILEKMTKRLLIFPTVAGKHWAASRVYTSNETVRKAYAKTDSKAATAELIKKADITHTHTEAQDTGVVVDLTAYGAVLQTSGSAKDYYRFEPTASFGDEATPTPEYNYTVFTESDLPLSAKIELIGSDYDGKDCIVVNGAEYKYDPLIQTAPFVLYETITEPIKIKTNAGDTYLKITKYTGQSGFISAMEKAEIAETAAKVESLEKSKANAKNSNGGFNAGQNSVSLAGVAIGQNAATKNGVAIGKDANSEHCRDAVQIGAGENKENGTVKFYDHKLMNADGSIPAERYVHEHALAGLVETDVDLTTCTVTDGNGSVTSKQLSGSADTFTITLEKGTEYKFKGKLECAGLSITVNGEILATTGDDVSSTSTFEYSGTVDSMTVYIPGGYCTFDNFIAVKRVNGFMTSTDKAKLDILPDDAYSKPETDSKIDLLSLKAEKSGETIRISDACELEQTADVSIASKNLIPYPYTDTTKTVNGVTFTDNGDAGVTVSGTPTEYTHFIFATVSVKPGQTYTLLKNQTGANNVSFVISERTNQSTQKEHTSDSPKNTFTFTTSESTDNLIIRIKRTDNGIACTGTFKPQLELGTQATAYTPHVSDISSVSVKKYGKNLIPYPYASTTKTVNGLTFTDNGDGSVTVSGTPTGNADFTFATVSVKPGQTFTLCKNQTGAGNITFVINERFNQTHQKELKSDSSQNTYTFTTSENTNVLHVAIRRTAVDTACTGTFKPQLELGNAATDYEPYKAPVAYTPDSDGKVSGVTLDSDTATLTTDTSGVIINAKYKKDITKAFEELETKLTNAILSNGGNV